MDPEGILKAWTTKVRMKAAIRMAMMIASAYSRIFAVFGFEVMCRSSFSGVDGHERDDHHGKSAEPLRKKPRQASHQGAESGPCRRLEVLLAEDLDDEGPQERPEEGADKGPETQENGGQEQRPDDPADERGRNAPP